MTAKYTSGAQSLRRGALLEAKDAMDDAATDLEKVSAALKGLAGGGARSVVLRDGTDVGMADVEPQLGISLMNDDGAGLAALKRDVAASGFFNMSERDGDAITLLPAGGNGNLIYSVLQMFDRIYREEVLNRISTAQLRAM